MWRGKLELKNQYAIFDIDGTLSEIGEREIYAVAGDWDEFNKRCSHDKPNIAVLNMCNAWASIRGNGVIILTGRSDKWITETAYWLELWGVKYDLLVMRDEGDMDHDYEVKRKALESFQNMEVEISFAVDDRDSCVEMFREEGITCFSLGGSAY